MSSPHHGTSVLWLFILGDLHFNIQYWAPAKASFDTHYAKVRRSLDTIEVVRKPASDPSIVREQRLAQRLRYARIVADQLSVEEARRTLQEARLEFALEPAALSQIDALLKEIEQAQRE